MEIILVKLAEGRRVRNPATGHVLQAEKIYRVARGQFWLRRLEAGDVVECPNPSTEKAAPKAAKKKDGG